MAKSFFNKDALTLVLSYVLYAIGAYMIAVGSVFAYQSIADGYVQEVVAEEQMVDLEYPFTTVAAVEAPSFPTRISIPSIGVETRIVQLGLNGDGTAEVPGDTRSVGWYKYGPTPGEAGSSVLLGHVDSYLGPAIFFDLKELKPGDLVEVARADGQIARFRVDFTERYEQSDFPTEKVYANTEGASLRLVTCTGTYDKFEQRYSHNLVVFATYIGGIETTELAIR